mgnify:CR=1 FL=1
MQALRVGIGGPVGSGKTALTLNLCLTMRDHYDMAVVTNDIYTHEDAQFLTRHDALDETRILPIFTSKQLFAQLILSGGLFTVLAPLMISKIGLDYWTEICALITFAILFIALIFNKVEMKKFQ